MNALTGDRLDAIHEIKISTSGYESGHDRVLPRVHEVRLALEPLAALANRAHLAVLGIIHHNKSGSTDPLQVIMGSRALTAVARSVHTVIKDPDDDTETIRLFGTPKNNLGKADLPTPRIRDRPHVIETDDGPTWTGKLAWTEDHPISISEAMRRASDGDDHSATSEASSWLDDFLVSQGGSAPSALIKTAGKKAGHSEDALKRARKRLNLPHLNVRLPAYHVLAFRQ